MTFRVESKRLAWPAGTVLGADDLAGCNIDALVQGGHLAPVKGKRTPDEQAPGTPRRSKKVEPEQPVTDDDSAEEPEEQE
ncbi:MAG TPA: hypothetical protein VIG24_10880 [Acidimicrobiia bacterium]